MSTIEYLYSMFNNALGLGVEDKERLNESDLSDDIENNIIYFDFETTGLNPFHDKVIELCFLYDSPKQEEPPSIEETEVFHEDQIFTSLVNPKRKFEEKITNITGIHPYDLINKPSIEELYPVLTNFLENGMVNYLIAHNCHGFDEIILKKILKDSNSSYILDDIC